MITLKIISRATGKLNEMQINTTVEKIRQWQKFNHDRPFIQDFFPELTADEREFILSGMTPQEWKDLYGDEE